MEMQFIESSIKGLFLIKPQMTTDDRGYFLKSFEKIIFMNNGLHLDFVEEMESCSQKGTLRGIHFQTKHQQGKLVHVIKGRVFDVAVDLRRDSDTFGQWNAYELSDINHDMLYIPKGFGHGFLALDDESIISYKCTDRYDEEHSSGIAWNDPDLNICWPLNQINELILSDADKKRQSFKQYLDLYLKG